MNNFGNLEPINKKVDDLLHTLFPSDEQLLSDIFLR